MLIDQVRLEAEDVRHLFPYLGKRYVGGEGGEVPRVMIVGDLPSAQAETSGRPFAGRTGVVLRQLVSLAGLTLDDCWFTNLLKYRTPGNRTPYYVETQAFRNVLKTEWVAIGKPRHIVILGPCTQLAIFGKRMTANPQAINSKTMGHVYTPIEKGFYDATFRHRIENEWRCTPFA